MKQDYSLHEEMPMPDYDFPIKINRTPLINKGYNIFYNHWHPQIELLYFVSGEGIVQCNSRAMYAKKGDLIVVNSNDLHQGKSIKDNTCYYCIIVDSSLLHSQSTDVCDIKYITPISQNHILFENKISNDTEIQKCIENIINEYEVRKYGFELAIKSALYKLIVLLLRKHVDKFLSEKEYEKRKNNLERFNPIFQYIENNFQYKISIQNLANKANLSRFHFCRLFKEITNMTPNEYLNYIRINKAETMLKYTDMNVTETALASGFNDLSYFSRIFKKLKHVSPSSLKKK